MRISKDYIGVGCGAFILNDQNQLLLQKRNKEPEKGYWSIPGGKVEMFETFEQAVVREIKEETDLNIEVLELCGLCDHIVDIPGEEKSHWVTPSYICRVVSGEAKIMEPHKHLDMKWFDLENLPEDITITTTKAVMDYLGKVQTEKFNLDKKLVRHIQKNVFPVYEKNDKGHGLKHIRQVISRSFELAKENKLDVDMNMVYTIAAYHDIGRNSERDKDNHEELSAEMMREDEKLKEFFSEDKLKLIEDAIVDHRASLEYEARSVYGKIVSSADREIYVDNILYRSYFFQKNKHPESDKLGVIENSYKKLSSKYGKGGYAKMYFVDKKYEAFTTEIQALLENKEEFIRRESLFEE